MCAGQAREAHLVRRLDEGAAREALLMDRMLALEKAMQGGGGLEKAMQGGGGLEKAMQGGGGGGAEEAVAASTLRETGNPATISRDDPE